MPAELFPLVVREHGLGAANLCTRAGAAFAPLFAWLQHRLRRSFVPLLVLGCLCLAAAVLSVGLPETLGEAQPATIQDLNTLQAMRRKRSWRVALAGMLHPGASHAGLQRLPSSQLSADTAAAAARSV